MQMSNEELVKAIQEKNIDTSEGMEQLYKQNMGIIHRIASKCETYGEMDDLLQEAYFGLYEAVMRYDESKGVKFVTYAFKWIYQAIGRYTENNGNTIRIPVYRQELLMKYRRLLERFEKEYNREPDNIEISVGLQILPKQVEKLKRDYACMASKSLDEYVIGTDNEKITIGDTIAADIDIEGTVLDDIIDKQFKEEFWGIINGKLDECEQVVIRERYKNNRTRAEMPHILPQNETETITTNECRRIENRALSKLKRSNLARVLNERFEIAITKAYRGSIWSNNVLYSPTERAAFKDIGIRI